MHTMNDHMPRPTFHFTPQRNWINDPNGLVRHRGLWHLYFQHNPEGPDWGNMSWGHATSTDLQHWTEHPVALPYRHGEQIFSGSVVAPPPDSDGPLTAYFTSAYADGHQAQSRATSRDGGYTWQLDPDNPILDRGTSAFRDPKVIRFVDHEGRSRWILLAVEADDRQVLFYSSDDLRTWEFLSTFGPLGPEDVVWECPDLVPLTLDDDPENRRWVLLLSTNPVGETPDPQGSAMHYVVGHFDGATFTADTPELTRLDHGRDCYAGVTFDSAPDGEALMLAWMSNWRYADAVPSSPWRGAMSLPRRLSLHTIDGMPRLVQEPPAFARDALARATPASVPGATQPFRLPLSGHSLVELQWDPAAVGTVQLQLRGSAEALVHLEHEPSSNILRVTRDGPDAEAVHPDFPSTSAVALSESGPMRLLMSLDGPLLEVFVNAGEATVSNLVVLGPGPVTATLATERRGSITLTAVDVPQPAHQAVAGVGAPG